LLGPLSQFLGLVESSVVNTRTLVEVVHHKEEFPVTYSVFEFHNQSRAGSHARTVPVTILPTYLKTVKFCELVLVVQDQ